MTDEIQPEIIDTQPVTDTTSPISTEGMAADLSAELAAEEAAKAEKAEAKAAKKEASSIDDALEKAMAKAKGDPEPKAKDEADTKEDKPKAQRAPDGKFAPAESAEGKAGEAEAAARVQSEGKQINAPARLLPSERDVWVNTPRAVQGAFERIEREIAEATEKHREATEFHEGLKQYAEMAKGANTTVKDALDRYVSMDKAIAANFGQGMAQIAQAHGKNPVEAVAQFMRAAGVLPQQLGAYLQGQPATQQAQPKQAQADPVAQQALQRIQQLEAQLSKQAEQQAESQRIAEADRLIESAMAEMPRFAELQEPIAKLLQSGMIDGSLSPDVKLREAYFMADRLNPALYGAPDNTADPDNDGKVTTLPRKKQISGSPSASSAKITPKGPAPSIDDALEAAFRRSQKR